MHTSNAAQSSPMVAWRDLDYRETEGSVRVGQWTVAVAPEHIACWRNDPDGRFKLSPSSRDGGSAELGRFYPSL